MRIKPCGSDVSARCSACCGEGMSRQESLCEVAARNGNLVQLKELRENGCPWDEETCTCAAMRGYLEVLQWARANGCPCSANT